MCPHDSQHQSLTLFLAVMAVYGSSLNTLPAMSQTDSNPAQKTIEKRLSEIKRQINELELLQRNSSHFSLGWDRENFGNTTGWQQGQWLDRCGQPPASSCPPSTSKPTSGSKKEAIRESSNSYSNRSPGFADSPGRNTGQSEGYGLNNNKNRNGSWLYPGSSNFRSPNGINRQ